MKVLKVNKLQQYLIAATTLAFSYFATGVYADNVDVVDSTNTSSKQIVNLETKLDSINKVTLLVKEEDVKSELDTLRVKFVDYLFDLNLSEAEQGIIGKSYCNFQKDLSNYNKFCKVNDFKGNLKINEKEIEIYKLFHKNINKIDFGVPEVQKYLYAEFGLDVNVDSVETLMENGLYFLGFICVSVLMGIVRGYLRYN